MGSLGEVTEIMYAKDYVLGTEPVLDKYERDRLSFVLSTLSLLSCDI